MVWYLYLSDTPGGEPVGSLQVSDRFPGGIPGLQWQWQANPHPETRLRPAEGNGLNLTCGYAGSLWQQPNLLSQMLPAADFTASVRLSLADAGAGSQVGFTVLGHCYSAMEFCRGPEHCTVRLLQGKVQDLSPAGQAEETILIEKAIDTDEIIVTMKVEEAKRVEYGFRTPDGLLEILGDPLPVTVATWTGARLGLYARGAGQGDTARAEDLQILL